ncbi:hypothetical protein [Desulfococcus multivorans]|uniref:Uncharacterized protein n=1 Tax=Desulfococcus multivorans DSM 2059 TaxID=1121405 RepID=S7UHE5_DESML|nr:hypothetical protein [Desulfococcus multivorans]AOY57304.1 conserved uncharacterized protein [Desulfococcus multivorans]AQU99753.1 hypothetical protein B2D07_02490 [Desulfococcus multivorans]EPR33254.1 hypothetical protein dsmv_3510 [Desulfococcus multivorans DSM 2059]SKA21683.1 hypothetical protein SAMN02745446_03321 [Desulfococcus multivorans DSM 2059]
MIYRILTAFFGFLLLAPIGNMVVEAALGRPFDTGDAITGVVLWSAVVIAIVYKAPTCAKAWRRIFLTCGVLCFAVPLAKMGSVPPAFAGAAVVGSGIVSIFPGTFFLIVGLLTGRNKQIIIIKESEGAQARTSHEG